MIGEFVYCPFSDLPPDADPTADGPSKYTFGSDIFGRSGDWIIVENGTDPVKVYRVPPPAGRIISAMMKLRYDAGVRETQEKLRAAIGINR